MGLHFEFSSQGRVLLLAHTFRSVLKPPGVATLGLVPVWGNFTN